MPLTITHADGTQTQIPLAVEAEGPDAIAAFLAGQSAPLPDDPTPESDPDA